MGIVSNNIRLDGFKFEQRAIPTNSENMKNEIFNINILLGTRSE